MNKLNILFRIIIILLRGCVSSLKPIGNLCPPEINIECEGYWVAEDGTGAFFAKYLEKENR